MIKGKIDGQSFVLSTPIIVSDTIDYLSAEFEFSDDWNDTDKWAHFAHRSASRSEDISVVYDVKITDNKIDKSEHLNLTPGMWSVYIHGTRMENGTPKMRITTNDDTFGVVECELLAGDPLPLTPLSAAERILGMIGDLEKLDLASKTDIVSALNEVVSRIGNSSSGGDGQDGKHTIEVVTPQMFGAVGDGVADDTEAVQAALEAGGNIYFPAGRYKVTRQLTATKSCKISMFKPYPSTYGADYPLTDDDNWMGARIETYSPTNGIILGDGISLDGFYIRAMAGFGALAAQSKYGGKGIVIQYDGSLGCKTYPSTVRLSHIRVDIDARQNEASYATIPECLLDFKPNGTYHYIIEDVILGQHLCRMCDYAFRADIENTASAWTHNVFVRNLCIDTHCDYGVYLTGSATGWMFEGLTVQAYGYKGKEINAENHQNRVGHRALVKISNAQDIGFYSCYLWDTAGTVDYPAVYLDGGEIVVDGTAVSDEIKNSTANISCVGCSPHFDVCETYISKKLGDPDNLNIKNLEMVVSADETTGGNILALSDGRYEQKAAFPAVAISDEQIGNAVSKWMGENASPKEVVGRNKFNFELNGDYTVHGAYDNYNILGVLYNSGNSVDPVYHDKNTGMWTTHFIPAAYGDVIRMSRNGVRIQGYHMVCYDSELEYIGFYQIFAGGSGQPETIDFKAPHVAIKDTAYIRICFDRNNSVGYPTDDENINLCITVNDTNISYEPYQITEEGGMSNWLPLDEITETIKGESPFVLFEEQELTEAEKATVRNNIGAVTVDEVLAALPIYNGEVETV